MKRSLLLTAGILFAAFAAYAQTAAAPAAQVAPATTQQNVGAPDAQLIGVDKAQQDLQEISINKFEDDSFWAATMNSDDGFVTVRRFEGAPSERKPLAGETAAQLKISDKYVLGVKVQHLHRAVTSVEIYPTQPLPIPGITKTMSVWVVGRNVKHQLYALISDQFGDRAKIPMGDLAFTGWKQLTAAIPPNIRQADPRYVGRSGITFQGFEVDMDPEQTYGTYYIYFDDLTVVTDLFSENNRDSDDMIDTAW